MEDNYQDRILMVMKERRESYGSLAKGVNRGKATISRYLAKDHTRTYPSVCDLELIAKYLDVEPHWLICGVGDRHTCRQTINDSIGAGAATVNVYSRADINALMSGHDVNPVEHMAVPTQYAGQFGVMYPLQGPLASIWDCAALISKNEQWQNDDLVFARIGVNAPFDFYTLVMVADKVHVWRGDDTTKNATTVCDVNNLEVLGVAKWGVWKKRS
ncbi:helix-turn-helix domain-containing protein [Vibrio panuliri]|uniref:Transcriptional regulator n=1 Tax=Vibrio panuliri TaxID=1381081 RepID=A0ABX3F6H8_9VIBR|nr:helix-turn-helix transcriptional regulator [Vibrio panuliri]KAB1457757.1 helix-turn-helix transcriptional regulator [Vibrio panuliri]OLQ85759.1 transcriptional regulator [Vibrio panuliri]